MNRLLLVLPLVILIALAELFSGSSVSHEQTVIGGVPTEVWLPKGKAKNTPVIIMSAGLNGCSSSVKYVIDAFTEAGYAVFFPIHLDSLCNTRAPEAGLIIGTPAAFNLPEDWNEQTYIERRNDIKTVLDGIATDSRYNKLDLNRIGVAGYSLGGYTGLAMAGAIPSWKDDRIKAVLALAPYLKPLVTRHELSAIQVPVMYQMGTNDWQKNIVSEEDGAYVQTLAPKSYIEFSNAGHNEWNSSGDNYYKFAISGYSVAFFDFYLQGKPFPENLTKGAKGITPLLTDMVKH